MRCLSRCFGLALLVVTVAAATSAASVPPAGSATPRPPRPQEDAESVTGASWRLLAASLRVGVDSPLAARVEAELDVAGDGSLELLLARFPGQTLSELRVDVNGVPRQAQLESTVDGAMQRLRVQTAGGRVELRVEYEVRQSDDARFRYPLPVPRAVPEAGGRPVQLVVVLPPGSTRGGDSFPRLSWVEDDSRGVRLEARLISVPSFSYVVFASDGSLARLDLWFELLALAVVTAPLLWAAWRWRRRARRQRGTT